MRALVFLILLSASGASIAQQAPVDVVVTAKAIPLAEKALDDCLIRRCSAADEANASVRVAEAYFVAGDYDGGYRATTKAWNHLKARKKQAPRPVAYLLMARSNLASLAGHPDAALFNSLASVPLLREAFGSNDPRVLYQRLEAARAFARNGRWRASIDAIESVEKDAMAAGQPGLAELARLRLAVMYAAAAIDNFAFRQRARTAIAQLEASTAPELLPYRVAARTLRARIALLNGDTATYDNIIRSTPSGTNADAGPMLVYEPRLDLTTLDGVDLATLGGTSEGQYSGPTKPEWADVAFWIKPDGAVDDVEVLRTSSWTPGPWLHRLVARNRARKYAPSTIAAAGTYRVERYNIVYDLKRVTGSRILARNAFGRLETYDMSPIS